MKTFSQFMEESDQVLLSQIQEEIAFLEEQLSVCEDEELAESIAKTVGYTGKIGWDTTKPNGNPRKLLDSTQAKMLGWEPKTPFEVGLDKTYSWYLENV